ncbi:flavonoid 3'-hydroxylase cytochrome P450 [Artemisia annua]|uniref:Flavonoid 3'-hydroxylase cytochrome P450 n=1 Tax=Artemisia annua TaxID=35608 RepID=A0A2U1P9T5_ARTAN|nr:flavonoid 3'-hydroxylase cytochrome P450 [Artemisia annua]
MILVTDFKDKIYYTMINYWSWWWEVDNESDNVARTILTILVPILVLLWYKWTVSYTKKPRSRLPPGPYGLPVIGLYLGSKLNVVVNSIDLAKVVARDLDQTFANRNPPVTAITVTYGLLDIAWSNNNTHWRNTRKLLVSQVLSNANLDACQGFRTDEVRKTVGHVYAKIGEIVDINEISFETELNVVTNMLWGRNESGGLLEGFREVEFKMIELLGAPNISDFIPMLSWFDLQGRKREMQKQHEHLDRILDNVIKARMEGVLHDDGKKDFLQIMLELKDQKDGPTSLNMVQIKALLFRTKFLQLNP